jgi:hypothetical protein
MEVILTTEQFGLISGGIVLFAELVYLHRVWKKMIEINIVSFALWTLIEFTLMVTYKASGAQENFLVVVILFLTVAATLVIGILRKEERGSLDLLERMSAYVCTVSLLTYAVLVFTKQTQYSQYALYTGLVAELMAAIPTWQHVWNKPWKDRPLIWVLLGCGYGLSLKAVPGWTPADYLLPFTVMFVCLNVAIPTALWRIKNRISIAEWI